jgi:hypothetical protein
MTYNKYHLEGGCARANGTWAMILSPTEFHNTLSSQKCKLCERNQTKLRQNPHYTAGWHQGFPYVGKTDEDRAAYQLGKDEAKRSNFKIL